MVETDGAPGVIALVWKEGRLLYRVEAGKVEANRPLPVASASKWVAAALIMTLVDDGMLKLDEPIGRHLRNVPPEAAAITLRQLLSFTSGQGGLRGLADIRQPPDISLAESARQILARPLSNKPGATFQYGSGALQVAGAIAEQASGKSWRQLFEERMAQPLGMHWSAWTHPLHLGLDPQRVTNPNLQGGLVTTAEDYGRFLTMIAADGKFEGRQILSREAVSEMERLQTKGLPLVTPPGRSDGKVAGYALGNWCERVSHSSDCLLVSSPGALGTYPWIDRERNVYGIFFMRHRHPAVAQSLTRARDAAIASAIAQAQ
jgi:CubicO group peptidase (beta-lactamase class C family)